MDLTVTKTANTNSDTRSNLLEVPLIKCKKEHADLPSTIKAYASGKRSALLIDDDGNFIRLKGCGNLDQGFPVEPMAYPPEIAVDVRGCQFQNSVYRELYFQSRVNAILHENNLTGANFPLGIWKYGKFNLKSIGLENEYPE